VKQFNWNSEKSLELKEQRGISFEELIYYLEGDYIITKFKHPNKNKYPNQMVYVVNINNYAYLVPYVETKDEIFLKSIIPSRKATKKYLGE
jgi:uncharacterized DUF497 family protein